MEPIDHTQPSTIRYRIRIKGKLDERWAQWFDGMRVGYVDAVGETTLSGALPDQTALHGLLTKIRDLNLDLISVEKEIQP